MLVHVVYYYSDLTVIGFLALAHPHPPCCIISTIKLMFRCLVSAYNCIRLIVGFVYALLAVSYFEGWLISAYRAFNADLKLFTHVCGYTLHKEQLSRLEDPDFLEALFAVANRLKKLNLGVDEECLLKGIMLLASGKLT